VKIRGDPAASDCWAELDSYLDMHKCCLSPSNPSPWRKNFSHRRVERESSKLKDVPAEAPTTSLEIQNAHRWGNNQPGKIQREREWKHVLKRDNNHREYQNSFWANTKTQLKLSSLERDTYASLETIIYNNIHARNHKKVGAIKLVVAHNFRNTVNRINKYK